MTKPANAALSITPGDVRMLKELLHSPVSSSDSECLTHFPQDEACVDETVTPSAGHQSVAQGMSLASASRSNLPQHHIGFIVHNPTMTSDDNAYHPTEHCDQSAPICSYPPPSHSSTMEFTNQAALPSTNCEQNSIPVVPKLVNFRQSAMDGQSYSPFTYPPSHTFNSMQIDPPQAYYDHEQSQQPNWTPSCPPSFSRSDATCPTMPQVTMLPVVLDRKVDKKPPRTCKFAQCTKSIQRNGLCHKHGGVRQCTKEGCTRKDRGEGYCVAHGGGKRCAINGCEKVVRRGIFCMHHTPEPSSYQSPPSGTLQVA
ncbi:hypothetical protein Ae201684P_011732 [Aphanomyces euteiches]|uniref:Uncharacterized protein n=1 Tax=Aphanomyces euteiches TaxID=100861 RepID=A0A6G0WUD5_9STRA|nr:hypothetical protein Ae201684_011670 [Aphanomyces euteiches]KAH9097000.1 hypothetical protein Ae201684P_011732 [Aphanomyces euteiches]KAH9133889.1 hypothetical protein AeRB84_020161 [Aphanomyces euteiches]